jgi:hypothetical protein
MANCSRAHRFGSRTRTMGAPVSSTALGSVASEFFLGSLGMATTPWYQIKDGRGDEGICGHGRALIPDPSPPGHFPVPTGTIGGRPGALLGATAHRSSPPPAQEERRAKDFAGTSPTAGTEASP